jgi:integrase
VNLRPSSVRFYRVALDRYLKPELGRMLLSELRADDIDRAFARIRQGADGRGNPVSPALSGRLKPTLRAAMNVAIKRKTKAGARTLSLARGTVAVLRSHRARQAAARSAAGPAWVDSGLVLTMADGRGMQPQYVTRLFTRARRDGGFPLIRLHDLRHTSASLGLAAGETLVEVSERLGHPQLAITADTYTHVLPVVALASSEKRAALIPRAGNGAHPVPSPGRASGDVPTPGPGGFLGLHPCGRSCRSAAW